MSDTKPVFNEIQRILKLPSEEQSDFSREVHKIKNQIQSSFASRAHQLHKRKQCLVDQVDAIQRSWLLAAKKHQQQLAETRGKLKSCLELSKSMDPKGVKTLENYAADLLETYQNLQQVEHAVSPLTLAFDSNKVRMSEMIAEFGKLTSNVPHAEDDASDCSWDLASSDLGSVDLNEPHGSASKGCKELTCCDACVKPGIEIEDINDYFSDASFVCIGDVCKANETCTSFSECLCDVPCYEGHVVNSKNPFVEAIEKEFTLIAASHSPQVMNPVPIVVKSSYRSESVATEMPTMTSFTAASQESFDAHVVALEKQFADILSGAYVPEEMTSAEGNPASPWSVGKLAAELDVIMGKVQETTLTTKRSTLPEAFTSLTSQLNAILNGEMPAFGMDDDVVDTDVATKLPVPKSRPDFPGKVPSAMGCEKVDPEKLVRSGKDGWCTVEDLHSLVTEILSD